MKDTLSRILAALAILVGLGTLVALYTVWSMLESRGDMLAGQLKNHDERLGALESDGAMGDEPQADVSVDTRPFMPANYQGTLPPNSELPSTTMEYRNTDMGLTFRVPYNPAWGDRAYRVAPFDESTREDGVMSVAFGPAGQWEGGGWVRGFSVSTQKAEAPEAVIQAIQEQEGDFLEEPAPEIRTVGDTQVVIYYAGGLCSYVHMVVIGETSNYAFSPICGNEDGLRDQMLDIVRTMEFIN